VNHGEQARQLVALGFPALEGRMAEVFDWLHDCNCPAYGVVAEFLRSAGRPLVTHVREVLRGDDVHLKINVLDEVVRHWPDEWVAELLPQLRWPDWQEGVIFALTALSLLAERRLEDSQKLRERLSSFKDDLAEYRGQIEEIERGLP